MRALLGAASPSAAKQSTNGVPIMSERESICPNCSVPLLIVGDHMADLEEEVEILVDTEHAAPGRGGALISVVGGAFSGAIVMLAIAVLVGWGC